MKSSPLSAVNSSTADQKVLIVGADGVIGAALEEKLIREGYQVTGSTRRMNQLAANRLYLDLEDPNTFSNLEHQKFDTAVICGAVTSLQMCEDRAVFARKINVDGTIALAELLSKADTHLIFLSTNLVFDGRKPHYNAEETKNPVTEYGKQKATVETYLSSLSPSTAIIRLGKVLPHDFPLFMNWYSQLASNKSITPYADKTIAPISLAFAVKILSWLVADQKPGIFQATACSDITYEEAALYLANALNFSPGLIEPINKLSIIESESCSTPRLFSTLRFSAGLADLASAPSPEDALQYAIHHLANNVPSQPKSDAQVGTPKSLSE